MPYFLLIIQKHLSRFRPGSLDTTSLLQFSQVFLGHSGALDIEGNELPRLVYVSREKRPGYQHHKKAGAENALVYIYFKSTNNPCECYKVLLKLE